MSTFDKDRLDKYLKSKGADGNDPYVIGLFANRHTDSDLDGFVKEDWNACQVLEEEKDLSGVLARVHHRINYLKNDQKQSLSFRLYKYYSAIAAVALLPLLILSFLKWNSNGGSEEKLLSDSFVNIMAPAQSRVNYTLPDSSIVCLNGGASIQVPMNYSENRHLRLNGEAYFDVTHNANSPFVVEMASGRVEVLGTRFIASAEDENYMKVILEEGKVKASLRSNSESFVLKPNQKLVFEDGAVKIDEVEAGKYIAWKDGKLIFRDDKLSEVAKRLGDWYEIDVELKDDALAKYSFRGVFVDEPLEEVLKMITLTLPVQYKIKERKQLPDDTYSSRTVVLFSR
ncbi:DUF4974 domain-containing protein [Marinilabiliaceae bacterium JC017]|nr:DUF4974 domain-containing protein [Marinilabiliaceae bacterium JC017]